MIIFGRWSQSAVDATSFSTSFALGDFSPEQTYLEQGLMASKAASSTRQLAVMEPGHPTTPELYDHAP
jgi:hypothetical protein